MSNDSIIPDDIPAHNGVSEENTCAEDAHTRNRISQEKQMIVLEVVS